MPRMPASPLLWWRDDWPTGSALVSAAPWSSPVPVGPAKAACIQMSRRDRREIYNEVSRDWHWRIVLEMIGFRFDELMKSMNKPVLLMVGGLDDNAYEHFVQYVPPFAAVRRYRPFYTQRAASFFSTTNSTVLSTSLNFSSAKFLF